MWGSAAPWPVCPSPREEAPTREEQDVEWEVAAGETNQNRSGLVI